MLGFVPGCPLNGSWVHRWGFREVTGSWVCGTWLVHEWAYSWVQCWKLKPCGRRRVTRCVAWKYLTFLPAWCLLLPARYVKNCLNCFFMPLCLMPVSDPADCRWKPLQTVRQRKFSSFNLWCQVFCAHNKKGTAPYPLVSFFKQKGRTNRQLYVCCSILLWVMTSLKYMWNYSLYSSFKEDLCCFLPFVPQSL